MDYIKSMFKTKSQNKHNFSLPLKAASGRNSAHSLPFDILEEIFLFVPYQYCQNIWIASSILQIPLAPKLKRLREYQEWVQDQIKQLKTAILSQQARIDEQQAEIDKLKIDYESRKTEINKLNTDIISLQTNIGKQQKP